jgi:hypothetical protein
LPQNGGTVQSDGQLAGFSPGSQRRLPHTLPPRQSTGQLTGVSPGSQNPLPQKVTLQSCGHVNAVSGGSQILLPHPGIQPEGGGGPPGGGTHGPQSPGQFREFSPASHTRLPQNVPTGQSARHVVLLSPAPQIPSPQKPQSGWQVSGFSGDSQIPLPQRVRQSTGQLMGDSFNSG